MTPIIRKLIILVLFLLPVPSHALDISQITEGDPIFIPSDAAEGDYVILGPGTNNITLVNHSKFRIFDIERKATTSTFSLEPDSKAFSWSPDGSDLAMIKATTSTFSLEPDSKAFSWSPDGSDLAMIKEKNIYIYDKKLKAVRQITSSGNIMGPTSWLSNKVVITNQKIERHSRIVECDVQNGNVSVLNKDLKGTWVFETNSKANKIYYSVTEPDDISGDYSVIYSADVSNDRLENIHIILPSRKIAEGDGSISISEENGLIVLLGLPYPLDPMQPHDFIGDTMLIYFVDMKSGRHLGFKDATSRIDNVILSSDGKYLILRGPEAVKRSHHSDAIRYEDPSRIKIYKFSFNKLHKLFEKRSVGNTLSNN